MQKFFVLHLPLQNTLLGLPATKAFPQCLHTFSEDFSFVHHPYSMKIPVLFSQNQSYQRESSEALKSSTTSSTGGLILPLQRGIVTARPEGRCHKHYYWSAYKAVLLEFSFLDSSACSLIYFCTASSVTLPIVST